MRITCNKCGKPVSTEVPEETILRGWIECPECIEKEPNLSKEEVIKMVESKKISLGFNVDYRKTYNSADMANKHNEALDDIIKELKEDARKN